MRATIKNTLTSATGDSGDSGHGASGDSDNDAGVVMMICEEIDTSRDDDLSHNHAIFVSERGA